MRSIEKTLEYHELIMTLDNLDDVCSYPLPQGYKFVFWDGEDCICDWMRIHLRTGEFASEKEAETIFHLYYDKIDGELASRCFFIVDSDGVKVATATVSPADEHGYKCALDWLGVSAAAQGKGLGKPLIVRSVELAKELGYDRMILHTQTHTWLAAKLYLDLGFKPFVTDGIKGWRILKTLTDHSALKEFEKLNACDLYDPRIVNIRNALSKIYDDFNYSVWYVNGRNDVFVNARGKYFHYKFYGDGKTLKLADRKDT